MRQTPKGQGQVNAAVSGEDLAKGLTPPKSRREKELQEVDILDPALKACVHEYGLPIVRASFKYGVKTAPAIRDLVREIWGGARASASQKRPPSSVLDWYLAQAGIDLNTAGLLRVLKDQSLGIVPLNPTREMLRAFEAAIDPDFYENTKPIALMDAIKVGSQHILTPLNSQQRHHLNRAAQGKPSRE